MSSFMWMGQKFHTYLDQEDDSESYEPCQFVEFSDGVAFCWDIEKEGLTGDYDNADVIYTEPAWPAGYKKFMEKAGLLATSYADYCASIARVIRDWEKPLFIAVSSYMWARLPKPDEVIDPKVKIAGGAAPFLVYNATSEGLDKTNNFTLIAGLAERYGTVGDFSAGYGNAGRIFREAGKRFVLSDVNPHCVGYIRDNFGESDG